jgi:hypothetical protein
MFMMYTSLLWYCQASNEIIRIIYDCFQHLSFLYFHKFSFQYLKDYLMKKLTQYSVPLVHIFSPLFLEKYNGDGPRGLCKIFQNLREMTFNYS